jgi:AraC-like DNA-binding protein
MVYWLDMFQVTKFAVDPTWKIMLKDLGVNVNDLLRYAQLPADIFLQKNAVLSTKEYFALWKGLEKALDDPLFPLKLGQSLQADAFNPPLFAALCSPNLNNAMERLSQYKKLIGPMTLKIEKGVEATTISLGCLYTDNPLPDSLIATELVFLVHLARLATREQIKPLFISSATDLINNYDYAQYFGIMPVKAKANQLKFSAEDANRPFLTENEKMWQFFEPELRKRLKDIEAGASFTSRVQSSLLELLPCGLGSAEDVAKKLAVSKRSLQRYLKNENTSFQQELIKIREKLARHYLANSTLSGAQISFLLGFDDPNSFVRAYRAWTGETPGTERARITQN